ncbi:alpha-amylase family protein [Actinoplanes sp. NPDC023936]|uniref:alpha-amylase family protein n=1 Tax=Actinoplanes sp. NPDC023936 TaxID=3154910 RepID=UPI0033DD78EB
MNPWIDYAIWWHVYPLGFTGAPRESGGRSSGSGDGSGHRLTKIVDWLDYLLELGANGLQLGPIFASETHGYDTVDHFRIDPRLGDDDDFDKLIAAARERGIRVLLDGVFNHVGRGFGAPAHWLTGAAFEGHGSLLELNHDEPEVADHVVRVMNHWLDRGASGWRLDAAYAVPPQFWRDVLARVRPAHPEAWFAGEVIHGDYPGYLAASTLDGITQYEMWKAIWSSLNDRNLWELAWAVKRHQAVLAAGLPMTFVGNHDVTRIASRLTDERHLAHALVVLFLLGGTPSIYYGDEQAYRGVKEDRAGGDDDVRPVFPASPAEFSALGRPVFELHQRLIGIRRRHAWLVRARTEVGALTNTTMALTSTDGTNRLTALLNIGDVPHTFPAGTVAPHDWMIVE